MSALAIVVAMNQDRVIGVNGGLPWHYSEDLRHFRRVTTGHCIIMGRKTWDSIGKPLPKRTNIVVTRDRSFVAEGAIVVHSLDEALTQAKEDSCPMIIGGTSMYTLALPLTTTIYLTHVRCEVEGDTWFPELDDSWKEVERREGKNPDLTFVRLERTQID